MSKTIIKLGFFIVVAVLCCVMAVSVSADDHGSVVDSGPCGDSLTWTLYEDGLLDITGEGDMWDYGMTSTPDGIKADIGPFITTAPWGNYLERLKSLSLHDGITCIGSYAFLSCYGIEGDLIIPNTVTEIKEWAFTSCIGLTGDLIIPNSVISIKAYSFNYCSGFNGRLILPDSLVEIGELAFYYSGFTGHVIIPDGVKEINNSAFYGCSKLERVYFSGNVPETFGYGVFEGTASVFTIYYYDSSDSKWTTPEWNGYPCYPISVDDKIVDFGKCGDNLTWILYEDGLLEISGDGEMDNYYYSGAPWYKYKDRITSLYLSDKLLSIGNYAFYGCNALTGSLTMPPKITYIGDYSFRNCFYLTVQLDLPQSLTYIGNEAFCSTNIIGTVYVPKNVQIIGRQPFSSRNGINSEFKDIVVDENNINYTSDDGILYNKDMTVVIQCPTGKSGQLIIPEGIKVIGYGAYSSCRQLTGGLILPSTLEEIEEFGFWYCDNLTGDVILPDGFKRLGRAAFIWDSGLSGKLVIPSSIQFIAETVAYNPNNGNGVNTFSSIWFEGNAIQIGQKAFGDPDYVTDDFTIYYYENTNGWEEVISEGKWNGYKILPVDDGINTIDLGATVSAASSSYSFTGEEISGDDIAVYEITADQYNALSAYLGASGTGTPYIKLYNGPVIISDFNDENIAINIHVIQGLAIKYYLIIELCEGSNLKISAYPAYLKFSDEDGTVNRYSIELKDGICITNSNYIAKGKCGDKLQWTLYNFGLLEISGEGDMYDYKFYYDNNKNTYYETSAPWYDYREQINSLIIEEGIISIGNYAFTGCYNIINEVIFPQTLTKIGSHSFRGTKIVGNLTIPGSVKDIYEFVFEGCDGINSVILEEGIETIHRGAFNWCSGIEGTVIFPNSIKLIDSNPFPSCINVTEFVIPEENEYYVSIDGIIYTKDMKKIVAYPSGKESVINIPSGIVEIGDNAFSNCPNLTGELIFPASLEKIGEFGFWKCTQLTGDVILPQGFRSLGRAAFVWDEGLSGTLVIPNTIEKVDEFIAYTIAADNKNINIFSSVIFKGSPVTIGQNAFGDPDDVSDDFAIYYYEDASGWDNVITDGKWSGYRIEKFVSSSAEVVVEKNENGQDCLSFEVEGTGVVSEIILEIPSANGKTLEDYGVVIDYDNISVFSETVPVDSNYAPILMSSGQTITKYPVNIASVRTENGKIIISLSGTYEITNYSVVIPVDFDKSEITKEKFESVIIVIDNSDGTAEEYEYSVRVIIETTDSAIIFTNTEDGEQSVIILILFADIDSDGTPGTPLDAMFLARWLARWEGYDDKINFAAADLDGDGIVTIRDAIILARHIAGWPGYEILPYVKP